jgi:hypothetical protein
MSKKLKIFIGVTFLVCVVLLVNGLVTNSVIKDRESQRDVTLAKHENDKLLVMEAIRNFLLVKDEESFTFARANSGMTADLKGKIFGTKYNSSSFYNASSVSFIDNQYSIEDADGFVVYLLANVTKGEVTKQLNLVVFSKNGTIYDIIAY